MGSGKGEWEVEVQPSGDHGGSAHRKATFLRNLYKEMGCCEIVKIMGRMRCGSALCHGSALCYG